MNRCQIGLLVLLAFISGMPLGAFLNWWQLRPFLRPVGEPPRAAVFTEAEEKEKKAMDTMRAAARRTAERMNALDELEEQKARTNLNPQLPPQRLP